jgi:hypothetical protein
MMNTVADGEVVLTGIGTAGTITMPAEGLITTATTGTEITTVVIGTETITETTGHNVVLTSQTEMMITAADGANPHNRTGITITAADAAIEDKAVGASQTVTITTVADVIEVTNLHNQAEMTIMAVAATGVTCSSHKTKWAVAIRTAR